MIRLFADTFLYYSFNESENASCANGDNYVITSLIREKEINTLSSLSFTTMMNHPRFASLTPKKTLILLIDDNRCLFIGKIATIKKDIFNATAEVEAEEILGCLRDSCLVDDPGREFDKHQYTYTYYYLVQLGFSCISGENVGPVRKLGYNCNVALPNATYVIEHDDTLSEATVENITGNDFLEIIYSTVLPWSGAILRVQASGFNYNSASKTHTITNESSITLVYSVSQRDANQNRSNGILPSSMKPNRHDFVYGENIISIDSEPAQRYPVSGILPYGTYTEELLDSNTDGDEYPLWLSKNLQYDPYLFSSESVNKIGYVAKSIDFGNVGKFSGYNEVQAVNKLYSLSSAWVNNHIRWYQDKMIITGIDRYYLTGSGREIDLCDIIRIEASPYSLDYYDYCLSLKVDYFNHANDQYIIGPYIPENELEYKISNYLKDAKQDKKTVKNKKNKKKG